MRTSNLVMGIGLGCLLLAACGQGSSTPTGTNRGAVLTADEAAVLAFLNDRQAATLEALDVDCGLRSDSALNIVNYLNGADETAGTADDERFDSLAGIDSVPMVGDWTIAQLKVCADSFGFTPTPDELAVLAMLNDAETTDFARLDVTCSLRADAARNLIAARNGPDGLAGSADDQSFHSMAEVDAVPQVGPSAIDQLKTCAGALEYDSLVAPEPDGGQSPPAEPTTCSPLFWDGSPDDSLILHETELSPELATRVAELFLSAPEWAHYPTNPIRFSGEVQVLIDGGVWVGYRVHFLETLESLGGIERPIVFVLDNCLGMVDVDHYF